MNQHYKGDHKVLADNKTTTYQNLWDTGKAVLQENMYTCIKK